ncbi:MAG: Do family serine endopeptidase [Muribaculaceae bacterium]|nr:Do family serine endopeptidase [Muribaculaceae bacterium]
MKVKYLVAVTAAAVMIPAAGMVYSNTVINTSHTKATEPEFITISRAPSFETDFTKAAESTVNSVVCIKSFVDRSQQYGGQQGGYMDPFGMFDFFFGPQQRQQPQQQPRQKKSEPVQSGLGSGVILSEDGYIVTNNHVVDGADSLEVLLNDNSTYEARIIGTDESTDLALIKIDAKGLKAIKVGDSENLRLGEWVLAVGNPFGFNSTVTAGIVSAKARSLNADSHRRNKMGIEAFIQTDAALNPGNSGGALVNLNGELVGINAAIYSNTGSYTGFSFAIPTTIMAKVVADLREYGTVQRAVLGITVADLTSEIAKEKGITATKSGVLVAGVADRSTAKELELQEDDVIVAINGTDIKNLPELHEQLAKYRPGQEITVSYFRDNKKITKKATLRNTQGDTAITKKGDFSEVGCAFMKLNNDTLKQLGISNGVKVTGLKGGPFKNAGVKDGFIIIEINDRPVRSSEDVENMYNRIMKDEDNEDKVMILKGIYPNGKKGYYAVNLAE